VNAAVPHAPRRLLVVTDEMEVGGSQRQIAHLLAGLDPRRWQAELLYFRTPSFLVDELEARGVRTRHLPKHGRIDLRFLGRLHALLSQGRYDVVHAYSLTAELWVRALLPLLPPMAFVASVRGLCLGYPWWQWRLKRSIARRADAIVANSRAGARMTAQRARVPLQRIDVIPNGVEIPVPIELAARAHARAQLAIPEGRVFGLFVGRLVPEKNLPLLLDAMAQVPAAHRPLLLLAGDGPLRTALAERIGALELGADVRLLGERRDAQGLMQLADFLVLPSREEGLSNVLLEAMAAGCAALTSDAGGNPELVEHEASGLLFPSGDAPALARALQRLCDDETLRTRLGAQARVHAQAAHSIATLVTTTEALYLRTLEDRTAGAATIGRAGTSHG
jgi:glycosyltransferase involved in cell wall biosynthesis